MCFVKVHSILKDKYERFNHCIDNKSSCRCYIVGALFLMMVVLLLNMFIEESLSCCATESWMSVEKSSFLLKSSFTFLQVLSFQMCDEHVSFQFRLVHIYKDLIHATLNHYKLKQVFQLYLVPFCSPIPDSERLVGLEKSACWSSVSTVKQSDSSPTSVTVFSTEEGIKWTPNTDTLSSTSPLA